MPKQLSVIFQGCGGPKSSLMEISVSFVLPSVSLGPLLWVSYEVEEGLEKKARKNNIATERATYVF